MGKKTKRKVLEAKLADKVNQNRTKLVAVRIPMDVVSELESLAEKHDVSFSEVVVMTLRVGLELPNKD
jgi:hypothetical protein